MKAVCLPTSFVLALAMILMVAPVNLHAQPWIQNTGQLVTQNFYDIQRAFNNYWKNKNTKERGKGWRPFKRWEWFWGQRVYPTGQFPNPMQLLVESQSRVCATGNGRLAAANWTSMGPNDSPGGYAGLGRLNCVRVNPNNPGVVWVGSASGGLWKTTNDGATWTSNTDELPSLGVTDIAFDPTNPNIMYMATGDGDASDTYSVGVLKSTDGGGTWNTTGLNWVTSQVSVLCRLLIHPTNSNILIAAGSGIHKTTNGGVSWTQVASGSFRDMEFKPGDPNTIYASGNSGRMTRSTDGGQTWSDASSGLPGSASRLALGVSPANPEYVYALVAATDNGLRGVYRSTNSGDSWTARATTPNLLGWAIDGSDQGGQGWYDLSIAVSQSNAERLYIGGVNNWKSTDGGITWTIATFWYNNGPPTAHADQHDLFYVPGTSVLYDGNDGGIYKSTDDGATWPWLGRGLTITQFYRFGNSATNPNVMIAGAQDNGTKRLNGSTWSDALGGDGMEALVDYSDGNILYGELYYGDIYRSMNGGGSFTQITNSLPETGGWVTPYVQDPTDPQTLYVGLVNVWKSTDRGDSWNAISSFATSANLTIVEVAPSNPDVIYVGTGSTLNKTTNGGISWQGISNPPGAGTVTYLAIHPSNPDQIWATSSGYSTANKVFFSTNGGTSWTNISGSLPNVPANCIVYQVNSPERVYVGTDIGVYYRDLTTSDWQDYNTGLPNVIVNELEIQYATRKLRAATYGRGVWQSDLVGLQGVVITGDPSTVAFGSHEVSVPSDTVSVTLSSFGSDTLVISSMVDPGSAFRIVNRPIFPLRLAPTQSVSFGVAFTAPVYGVVSDSIVVYSNSTSTPAMAIHMNGKGVVIGRTQPGVMYATSAIVGSTPSRLYTINQMTGVATLIGPTGISEIDGLAIHPVTRELYGVLATSANTTLYRISHEFGDALPERSLGIPNMRAIAFDATGTTLLGGTSNGRFYLINPVNGDTNYVGTAHAKIYSGFSLSPTSDMLWASARPPLIGRDSIYYVDRGTGTATAIGRTGLGVITPSIAFNERGNLFALIGSGSQINMLYSLDTLTATATLIGSTGVAGLQAIAMRTDSAGVVSVGPSPLSGIPESFELEQNYPNPFNPVTQIRYGLPAQSRVVLTIHNILGQEVARLVDGVESAGYHEVAWVGTNTKGVAAASGLYFYKLEASGEGKVFTDIKKMLLLK